MHAKFVWFPAKEVIYEGCLLYFGIREQKKKNIIENRFIVFDNIPQI